MRIHRHQSPRHSTAAVLIALTAFVLAACDTADDTASTSAVDVTVDDDGITTLAPRRDGSGLPAPVDVLSVTDEAALLFMREEERLALDVSTVLGDMWGLPIFANIAEAEQTHTESVRVLLERYGLDDPVPSRPAGEYADATLQAACDELIELGGRSLEDALRVGAIVEELDIADLRARQAEAPDVAQVFTALERGSRNHLRAFVGQLEQRGAAYAPTHLTQDEVDEILAGEIERGPVSG